jgi:hypothetical protein
LVREKGRVKGNSRSFPFDKLRVRMTISQVNIAEFAEKVACGG